MNQPTGPSDRDVLFAGMQQLQDVVAKMAKGSDRDDSNSPTSPETVKPGITSLAMLAELKSDEGSLLYQDWLVVIGGLLVMFRIPLVCGGPKFWKLWTWPMGLGFRPPQ